MDESGIPLNKGNIHIAKTSPHSVLTGVHKSFERNFTLFLRLRSQEMVSGGHMVLTIIGSDRKADSSGNQSCTIWELLGITLNDMVQEIQNPLCSSFPLQKHMVCIIYPCSITLPLKAQDGLMCVIMPTI